MLNPDQIIEIGKARQAHLRQEAQHDRLIKEARGSRPKLDKQFLKWSGDILIRLGYKLQGHQQQPTVHSDFQASRFTFHVSRRL
jgi:hypothetical protein